MSDNVEQVWQEVVGRVQADEDAEVRAEARGLMVAEMAEVVLADRLSAVDRGVVLRVSLRGESSWLSGRVIASGPDFVVLQCAQGWVLVPLHAMKAAQGLPRVLHSVAVTSVTWQRTMRRVLGMSVAVHLEGTQVNGSLSWVGKDHLSMDTSEGEVTLPWFSIVSIDVPSPWLD